MKKTFRFLLMGIMAVSMAFTSCKGDEEDSKPQPEQTSFSYNLEGETSWEPKSLIVGEEEGYVIALAAKDLTTQEILEFFNGSGLDGGVEVPSNIFMMGLPNVVGEVAVTGNLLDEAGSPYGCIFITGTTELMGQSIPTGWVSTSATINVTKLDLTAMKYSATMSATMGDFISIMTEGSMGSSETKTFTASLQNVSLVDIYAMMGK